MSDHIYLDGIGIAGYRSFGEQIQRIGPFGKINLFLGQNNSGKSNILRLIREHYRGVQGNDSTLASSYGFSEIDVHQGATSVCVELGRTRERIVALGNANPSIAQPLLRVLKVNSLFEDAELAWFMVQWQGRETANPALDRILSNAVDATAWSDLWRELKGRTQGNLEEHWVPQTLAAIAGRTHDRRDVLLVPAIRKIATGGQDDSVGFDGRGIIERLNALQNPTHDRQNDLERFGQIQRFARDVTANANLRIAVPHDKSTINVYSDGRLLPIESLGTGIAEVMILAAAATVHEEQILCMEEPEIHLHPLLQRKLIDYLLNETSNQYFITTHSGHLVDAPDTRVFHVRLVNGATQVRASTSPDEKFSICTDLGCRASDLLQSNCVIWVEGPSDRIYLSHWIRAVASDLVEGIHYSVMFYGGRLLSHLTSEDPEVDDFISLRRINRNVAVIIDSDKDKPRARPNKTKRRIRDEFDKSPGLVWITQGREIENYVAPDILRDAVEEVAPGNGMRIKDDRFRQQLRINEKRSIDKVKVARAVAARDADLLPLDLKKQINVLVKFIRRANGI